jgi:pyruvate formate lyase activating enzyme
MLDIKHIDAESHKALTGMDNAPVLAFARFLEGKNVPVWIRHVVVEGYTDNEEQLYALGEFIGSLKNARALDVLPYHNLGESKYRALGISYALEGIKPLDREMAVWAKQIILNGVKAARKNSN